MSRKSAKGKPEPGKNDSRDVVAFIQAVKLGDRTESRDGILGEGMRPLAALLGIHELHSFSRPWEGYEIDRQRLWGPTTHCTGAEWLALRQLRELDRRITDARLTLLDPNSSSGARADAVALAQKFQPIIDKRLIVLAAIHYVASNPSEQSSRWQWTTDDQAIADNVVRWLSAHLTQLDQRDEAERLEEAAYENAGVIAEAVRLWARRRGGRNHGGSKWRAAYLALHVLGLCEPPINASRADALRKLWEGNRPR